MTDPIKKDLSRCIAGLADHLPNSNFGYNFQVIVVFADNSADASSLANPNCPFLLYRSKSESTVKKLIRDYRKDLETKYFLIYNTAGEFIKKIAA